MVMSACMSMLAKIGVSLSVFWVVCAIAVVVFVTILLTGLNFANLWLIARLSGCPVPFVQLVSMRLRKVDLRTIIFSHIRTAKAGIAVPVVTLETHYLAGGRVPNVISALIAAHKAGIPMTWDDLAALDLANHDVLAMVQEQIDRETGPQS